MNNCERGQIFIALGLLLLGYYHDSGLLINLGGGVLIGTGTVLVLRF
jgi:hypothetical protein